MYFVSWGSPLSANCGLYLGCKPSTSSTDTLKIFPRIAVKVNFNFASGTWELINWASTALSVMCNVEKSRWYVPSPGWYFLRRLHS